MAEMSLARIRRIQRARRRRPRGSGSDGDPAYYRAHLEKARHAQRDGRRSWDTVTFWRQRLTLAAAHERAKAGDRTAQYRLAWREAVCKWEEHAEWLASRFRVIDREIERMIGDGARCAGCAARLERLHEHRAWYLAEIAQLPGITSYAAFVREAPPPTLDQYNRWRRDEVYEDAETETPEQTVAAAEALAYAGVSSERQSEYQRKMSTLLGGGGA